MNKLGFKHILIVVIISLLILALGITSFISINKLSETTKNTLVDKITSASQYEANNIKQYIASYSQPVSHLAALYKANNYQTDHEKHMLFAKEATGVAKLTLGFDDGRSYTSRASESFPNGVGIPSKYDPRTRSWYQLGKKSEQLALSEVFATKQGVLLLLAVHAIKDGVIASDVRLTRLQTLVESVDVAKDSVAILVDQKGMVLASTSEVAKAQDQIQTIPELSDFSSEMLSSERVIADKSLAGEPSLLVSTRVELEGSEPWYLMIAVKDKVAFAAVSEATWSLLMWVVLITLLFIVVFVFVLNRIYQPVIALKTLIANLSSGDGDLTQRLTVKSQDDLGQIAGGVNRFIETLQLMMLDVKKVSGRLSEGVETLKSHSDISAGILAQHQQETDQVVTAVEELSVTAEMVAANAQDTAQFTQEANNSGETSKDIITNAQVSLQRLSKEVESATVNVANMSQETQDIGSILSVIGAIADQTNLLALNAAIEAARAGEQGRGFAVVADEVRALAARTQTSTGEVENALEKLRHESTAVVSSIDSTRATSQQTVSEAASVAESLEVMNGFVSKINDLSNQIASSAQEQNAVIREVSQNMARIHSIVQELSTTGADVNQETHHIHEVNEQLNHIVGRFKLDK
ncbi:methyl-accepting chemotaxis protein [Psychromonas sp. B3M02]|uniref:methyl-accepting chemotaxis protein n=1 Tax=Psychromonas sp. B3M02 TaxID=2267226 RepID=UPI000DEB269E|nr:methyl-accepting chemotaxis protein [Psychromonas sp. B3M02]RBW46415.1 methyl-accepting chemotaxis protein [Psychromonas sp. B3M02]